MLLVSSISWCSAFSLQFFSPRLRSIFPAEPSLCSLNLAGDFYFWELSPTWVRLKVAWLFPILAQIVKKSLSSPNFTYNIGHSQNWRNHNYSFLTVIIRWTLVPMILSSDVAFACHDQLHPISRLSCRHFRFIRLFIILCFPPGAALNVLLLVYFFRQSLLDLSYLISACQLQSAIWGDLPMTFFVHPGLLHAYAGLRDTRQTGRRGAAKKSLSTRISIQLFVNINQI